MPRSKMGSLVLLLGLAACGGDSLDPASVDLMGTWNASVSVDYTAPDNSLHHCQAVWSQDVTTFQGSQDTLEAVAPAPILLNCGGGLSPAWSVVGQGFLWIRSGSQIQIRMLSNGDLFAPMTIVAASRLTGTLEPAFAGTSPLVLSR